MKHMKNKYGFSLIELLIVMGIFSVVMAGLYAATSVQLREGVKEYRLAESEMELGISKNIIERDINMGGYGLMDDYDFDDDGTPNFNPRAIGATDDNPDTLTLMGTALGLASRAAQGWAPAQSVAGNVPSFMKFNDAREDVLSNDRIIIMDPNTKGLVGDGTEWRFKYIFDTLTLTSKIVRLLSDGSNGAEFTQSFVGMTVYGISHDGTTADITQPYYAVRYYLPDAISSPPPALCAPGTKNLLRAESKTSASPAGGAPMLNCVLDFQVALGLDTNDDGTIDLWDNGGVTAQGYASKDLNKRLKQVRAYVLVQAGNRDQGYTYSNPDPDAGAPDKIRVGDLYLKGGATGRDVQLTPEQRKYRWKVVTFAVTPRNTR